MLRGAERERRLGQCARESIRRGGGAVHGGCEGELGVAGLLPVQGLQINEGAIIEVVCSV